MGEGANRKEDWERGSLPCLVSGSGGMCQGMGLRVRLTAYLVAGLGAGEWVRLTTVSDDGDGSGDDDAESVELPRREDGEAGGGEVPAERSEVGQQLDLRGRDREGDIARSRRGRSPRYEIRAISRALPRW